ncbi:MAG: 4-aminobutyrate aminotransferase / (S)-3-amino-2-methylpropionate transaminase / 5-aminovalerate [Verrucomicrobiota bacterium]|jgi:4-aminobutyrate aminotransferase-like enzyme
MLTKTHSDSKARTKVLFDEEHRFIAPGLQTIALLSELAIAHGSGATLTDLDGQTYLDLNAGVSVASLGHAHPRYVAALTRQLEAVTVGSFTSQPRAELVKLIADLAPGELSRTQFFSGGAEAVEAAIRLARSFTKRTDIVGFTGGFHGKTAGVLPLSDVDWKTLIGPLPTGHHLAPYADPTTFEGSAADCREHAIKELRRVIEQDVAGRPAAIVIEPIQGTAGNIVPPPGFLRDVLEVAHEYGALLIADEMITGFGRTGRMFGCNSDGVVPDVMTLGKGMASGFPVSALVSTDEIMAAKPFSLPSASSSSYGGNPLAAAAALVTIQTILSDKLVENSAAVGSVLRDGLQALSTRHRSIENVRGQGLLIGFDFVTDQETKTLLPKEKCIAFFKDCLAEGLIMMSYTPRVRVHPPLILSAEQANSALAIIDRVLERLETNL